MNKTPDEMADEELEQLYNKHAKQSNRLIQHMSKMPGDFTDHITVMCMTFGATIAAANNQMRGGEPKSLESLIKLAQTSMSVFAWRFHKMIEAGMLDEVAKQPDEDTRH